MITEDLKVRVVEAAAEARKLYTSDAKFAVSVGIDKAAYSRIKKGDTDQVLSEAKWISLARKLDVPLKATLAWNTADTPVFQYVTAQLEMCQKYGSSSLLCDLSDIGKTYAAKYYARTHKNAVYVDCSQAKTSQRLIRYIAKEFGLTSTGRYSDVYEDLCYYIKSIDSALVILDEFGDIKQEAFLEVKALWNAVAGACSFYAIGADGLEAKMHMGVDHKTNGYTETFSRFGKVYGKMLPTPKSTEKHSSLDFKKSSQSVIAQRDAILRATAMMIIKANSSLDDTEAMNVFRGIMGDDGRPSLRRIPTELAKREL
jgi:hypothetical protein